MRQEGTTRPRSIVPRGLTGIVARFLPPILFFAVAFTLDMLTGQRYSSIWGSGAIVASVIHLFPAVRPTLLALGAYAGVWVGFNLVRAFADDAGMGLIGTGAVAEWERGLFGGVLPSARLQTLSFEPEAIQAQDVILSIVHGSFFIVPFVVAGMSWWRHRDRFPPYALATAATFALGLVGFLLVPTSPPWLVEPNSVSRITQHVLTKVSGDSSGSSGAGFAFEPNHLAAMPSVHVAATVLVYLHVRQFGWIQAVLGAIYAMLMSLGVVYLGEHYVVDAVLGWVIAVAGWWLAMRWMTGSDGTRNGTMSQ
jgi:membrane-associated phospholipid phosphatase